MVECTRRGIIGLAPFWHPVVRYEVAAVWKHLLKHLPVVVGLFSVGDDTTELGASLSKHLLVNLHEVKGEIDHVMEFHVRNFFQ